MHVVFPVKGKEHVIPWRGLWLCCLLFISAFSLVQVERAQASSGDEHVIGADSPVSQASPNNQFNPVIGGTVVFWQDTRPVEGLQNFTRLFYRDLSRPETPEQLLTPEKSYFSGRYKGQYNPSAAGSLVAWEEVVTTASGGRSFQPRFIDMNECPGLSGCPIHQIPIQQADHPLPAAANGRIVWEDSRAGYWESDIYMYDIAMGTVVPVSVEPGKQATPDVDGDWVVWLDNRGGTYVNGKPTRNDIFAKNIVTGQEVRVTADEGQVLQGIPRINGNLIVYSEETADSSRREDINVYDLSTGMERTLYSGEGIDRRPNIEGNLVVWEACKDGIDRCRIWLHDLSSGVSQPVSAPAEGGGLNALLPAASSSGRIVWQDNRQGRYVIYQNRLGDRAGTLAERFKPELHFPHDINNPGRTDFEPRTANLMVDVPGTRLITQSGAIENPTFKTMADNPNAGNYLDLAGSPFSPGFFDYSYPYLRQVSGGGYPVTAYTRLIANAEGSGKTVIQYWLYYFFNDWLNNHEGDWEMVEVILNPDFQPEAVVNSQHGRAFIKYWDEPGLEKTGEHPRVFVAGGSHANYFSKGILGRHFHEGKLDHTGDASATLPAVDMAGLAGKDGWLDYQGLWGQKKDYWYWLYVNDGPPGPRFQPANPANGASPWERPLTWGMGLSKGDTNDLVIECFACSKINLYDEMADDAGVGPDETLQRQIAGSEYFERGADGSKNIVIHSAGFPSAGYRLEMSGGGDGAIAGLNLQVPDFGKSIVDKLSFSAIPVGSTGKAVLEVSEGKDYVLRIDADGDGIYEDQRQPGTERQQVDFIPPARIDDLKIAQATSSTATLTWTAPGDDGASGTAARYEVRYSTEPITEESWQYAKEAGQVPGPQAAGSSETATVPGLAAGTRYYFAVRARDDVWQLGPLCVIVQAETQAPRLTWAKERAFWASYADYQKRELTVSYRVGNSGTGKAEAVRVQASFQSPDSVSVITPLPLDVGDIVPGTARAVPLKYRVPSEVRNFKTLAYGSCLDDAGRISWFPGPLPRS